MTHIIFHSKGWGFPIFLIIGCVQMAVCHWIYGNFDVEFFEHSKPAVYWRTGVFSGLVVAALGYYLNQYRRAKEDRAFGKALHSVWGIPIEYYGGFWMLVSLLQSWG